ncbi:MAG TPA: PQQ-binding-like beta-propeller repeat protein [Pyrinomonadaceae bacterium]|nr:PQQ-binding-like beta-propeller repeat protein [Pyrinomonadaceae bacterium]
MKNLPLPVFGLLCALFATTVSGQVPADQARNFQINETHTGATTSNTLIPPLRQRWVVNFGQPISYPLIADGRVYVTVKNASGQGTTLFTLSATNGATLWSSNLGGSFFWSGSCYENGRVFALNGSGLLRAFDGATGAVVWSAQLPGQFAFTSAPTVRDGVIYTGGAGSGGTVYAVNANTGALLWTSSVLNGDYSSPAVTSDGVYVSYACPNVYKLDPATGAKIWHYAPGCSGGGGKTPAFYNDRLYVRDSTGTIHDSFTGALIGNFTAKNTPAFSGSRGFFLDGPNFFGSFGTLRARDVDTNTVLWSFAGDGSLQSAVLVVNDYVYVGSALGKLYAVNAATGQQAWVTTAGTSIPYVDEHNVSQPTTSFAAGEGLLVVPTSTTLVAYEGDTAPPTVTWGNQTPAANGAGWNNTPVDLPFTTADDLSGVQSSDPASPLHFTSEGANQTQDVTVTDNVGNSATYTSPAVNIDLTAPSTSIQIPGTSQNQEWFTAPVSVTLSATDNLSGVASTLYSINGGPAQTYASTFSISNDGNYTIEFWSVDVASNSETHQTRIVRIDSTAPVTQASVAGAAGTNNWYRSSVQVSLSATDNVSGVANTFYSVDGGATQTYAGAFVLSTPGEHTVQYWSVDNQNNTEATKSLSIKIDTLAPVVTAAANPSTAPKRPQPVSVTISGSATDALSGVSSAGFNVIDEYGVTQPSGPVTVQANGSYSFTLSLPATKNGSDKNGHLYTIVVTATDQAGNSASATTTLRIN